MRPARQEDDAIGCGCLERGPHPRRGSIGEQDRTPVTEDDPDAEMRLGLHVALARLLAEYRASCGQLSELVAPLDLDTESGGTLSWRNEPVTLRWVLMHLIEETARHNGHIDLLREMADGLTGR